MRKEHEGPITVKMDFRRPACFETPKAALIPSLAERKREAEAQPLGLEYGRQLLRGIHSGMIELRRTSEVTWECPAANFGLLGLTDQLAGALAVLEEVERK